MAIDLPPLATSTRFHPERSQRRSAVAPRVRVDSGIDAPAVAVHGDAQGTEVAHAKTPQTLRMQIVEIDVLDRLDPGGLQRRSATDDREIRAAEFGECSERA